MLDKAELDLFLKGEIHVVAKINLENPGIVSGVSTATARVSFVEPGPDGKNDSRVLVLVEEVLEDPLQLLEVCDEYCVQKADLSPAEPLESDD